MTEKIVLIARTEPPPAWLPNWRDASAYVDHGEDWTAWAWEFLRRNPEYRADYRRWAELPDSEMNDESGRSGVTPKWKGGGWEGDAMRYFHVAPEEPQALPGETLGAYRRRTGLYPLPLREHMEVHYGLMWLTDPDQVMGDYFAPLEIDTPPTFLRQCEPTVPGQGFLEECYGGPVRHERRELIRAHWQPAEDEYKMVVAFDLRYPLEAQFEEVRRAATPDQDSHTDMLEREIDLYGCTLSEDDAIPRLQPPRPTPRKLMDCLRVFDAEWAEGWNRKEIAAAIFPAKGRSRDGDKSGLDSVDYARKQGQHYVTAGWRELMRWDGYPRNLKKPRNP